MRQPTQWATHSFRRRSLHFARGCRARRVIALGFGGFIRDKSPQRFAFAVESVCECRLCIGTIARAVVDALVCRCIRQTCLERMIIGLACFTVQPAKESLQRGVGSLEVFAIRQDKFVIPVRHSAIYRGDH